MTQAQFDKAIADLLERTEDRLTAQLDRVRRMRSGTLNLRRVKVRQFTVCEHTVKRRGRVVAVGRTSRAARLGLRIVK